MRGPLFPKSALGWALRRRPAGVPIFAWTETSRVRFFGRLLMVVDCAIGVLGVVRILSDTMGSEYAYVMALLLLSGALFHATPFLARRKLAQLRKTLEMNDFLLCPTCGYPLTGLPDGARCPECGAPMAPDLRSIWEGCFKARAAQPQQPSGRADAN